MRITWRCGRRCCNVARVRSWCSATRRAEPRFPWWAPATWRAATRTDQRCGGSGGEDDGLRLRHAGRPGLGRIETLADPPAGLSEEREKPPSATGGLSQLPRLRSSGSQRRPALATARRGAKTAAPDANVGRAHAPCRRRTVHDARGCLARARLPGAGTTAKGQARRCSAVLVVAASRA